MQNIDKLEQLSEDAKKVQAEKVEFLKKYNETDFDTMSKSDELDKRMEFMSEQIKIDAKFEAIQDELDDLKPKIYADVAKNIASGMRGV